MTITTRSKRVSAFGTGTPTPAPGEYATEQVITSFGIRAGRPLFSSFATTEKRILNENKTTSAITPGPGAYIDESRHQHGLPPSNVFATKISRFAPSAPGSTVFRASTVQDNPGPGSYLRPASSPPSNNQREHQHPHKFAHLVKPSVPAIPQRQQSYGYVQVGVELQRQAPPEEIYSGVGHDTVGPAAYSRHNPIWNEKKNAASSLKSTAKRDVWEENKRFTKLPGPGQYNTNCDPETVAVTTTPQVSTLIPEAQRPRIGARRSQHRAARQSAVFASKVPILPAPKPVGVYDPEREQELQAKDERAERYRQEQNKFGGSGSKTEAFGSTTGRAGLTSQLATPFCNPSYTSTPGPGRYGAVGSNPASKRLGRKASRGTIPHRTDGIGFSCATERPCLAPTKTPSAPGPGAYKSETPRSMNQAVKGKLCIGRNGVFGTTSERQVWGELERKDAAEFTPGPGTYSEGGTVNAMQYLNSAAFKSSSTRFSKNGPPHAPPHVHCVGDNVTPAVGQYNVSKGFSAVASSAPEVFDDAAGLLSPRVPFLSTQERSVFDTRDVCDLPGPGAYRENGDDAGVAYTRSRDVRLTVGNEARFRVKPTVPETVGPGAYSIPGTVGTKSFNVTMTQKDKARPAPTRARGSPIQKTSVSIPR